MSAWRDAEGRKVAMSVSDVGRSASPGKSFWEHNEYFRQLATALASGAAGTTPNGDRAKVKERTRNYYDSAAVSTRVQSFWNLGYSSADALREIQDHIPEFGRHNETDGLSEQLYFATVKQMPLKLDELAEMSLLDVGCGLGEGLNFLSRMLPGTRMVGLDLSPNAVGSANARLARGSALSFVCGDAESIPFDDAGIDVVISVESAQFYPDNRRFLQEVARTLKPGGYFSQADLYIDDEGWERTLSARKGVDQLEWIRDKDISPEVRTALTARLMPGSHFHRKFGDVPQIARASLIRHFDLLCGQSVAEAAGERPTKIFRRRRSVRAGAGSPGSTGASYRLSLAQRT